jgi:peptidoglycan/xylan/chitin deacetylase (PgdA/CDA1 family)
VANLPVLMYHNVNPTLSAGLTISCDKLDEQLTYLCKKKYTFYFASELVEKTDFANKSIVITFDDVTQNQLLYALPILKKYNVKATFFIPFGYIGKTDLWNKKNGASQEKIMTVEQLKSIDSGLVEFGHHSFNHNRYSQLSKEEILNDFKNSYEAIKQSQLKVFPILAYPYGDFPKKGIKKEDFFDLLEKNGIKAGFRIGNRVNKLPIKSKYEIQRIDIKGEDSLLAFKLKIRFGKLRLF